MCHIYFFLKFTFSCLNSISTTNPYFLVHQLYCCLTGNDFPHIHHISSLLPTALATGRINCSGGVSLEAALWRQQLDSSVVAAADLGQQLGISVLAAA
jgi:hypothetical protein